MSEDNSALIKDIRDQAKLALASNRISDVQEKNLKMYPLIFFNEVKKATIDYDFTNDQTVDTEEDKKKLEIKYKFKKLYTGHFRVSYFLELDEKANEVNLDKRFIAIEGAVRNLFWNETKVQVYLNGTLKFESKDVGSK